MLYNYGMTKPHANKGRKQSPEHIAKRVAARKANNTYKHSEESKARMSDIAKASYAAGREGKGYDHWKGKKHTPETRAKMSEVRKQMWEDGRYETKKPATRRRTSKMELSLKPYLKKLGYRHNTGEEIESFIRCPDKTRLPDFIDIKGRRVFEFFGDFWHKPEDEAVWIKNYAAKNWTCTVLWEHDLPEWLEANKHLVTERQHKTALTTCRVRTKL